MRARVQLRSSPGLSAWMLGPLFLFLAACGAEEGESADGGVSDSAVGDGGVVDGDVSDGDMTDAATPLLEEELFTKECPGATALAQALRERARQLDQRTRELDQREHSIRQLNKAIDVRLAALEKAHKLASEEVERLADERAGRCREQEIACNEKIADLRTEFQELERGLEAWDESQEKASNEARDREVQRLTKALGAMRPEKAAATLTALERATAAEILSQLPERSSGKILAALDPSRTADIVQVLLSRDVPSDRDDLRALGQEEQEESEDSDDDQASAEPEEGS